MKKIFTLLLGIILSVSILTSQEAPPQAFSFKAMIKDNKNQPVVLKTVSLRISILRDAANGTTVYCETFRQVTNVYAQVDIEIGRGTVVSGIFSAIDWSADEYFIQVEVDVKGGTNYQLLSVAQLLSVPYALYAGNLSGGSQDNDDDPLNELISNAYLNGTSLVLVENNRTTIVELSGLLTGIDASTTNELQDLFLNGHQLTIENGNTVTLPDEVNDADADPANEIQVISLEGNILTLSTNGSPIQIDLSKYLDNTDNQTLSVLDHQLTIQNGNTVPLPDNVDDADHDPLNEIQQLSISGDRISLSREGGYVEIPVANTVNGLFFYGDRDKDSYGDQYKALWVPVNVTPPDGYVSSSTDCNDSNAEVRPGARDICDGLDNDCDGITDENCLMPECYQALVSVFRCMDNECYESTPECMINSCDQQYAQFRSCPGYQCIEALLMQPQTWQIIQSYTAEQKANYLVEHCSSPDDDTDGYTIAAGDCNDTDPSVHPGAIDIPGDGIDQNCNGRDAEIGDDDDDTYTEAEGDCNDNDPAIHPGVTDMCDGVDNDCDGQTDEDASWRTYYLDSDHDGYGDPAVTASYCSAESASADSYILSAGDCNDNDPGINPGIDEANENLCGDGIDQDCKDGDLPCSAIEDNDGDGYTEVNGDCDDTDDSVYPGAPEIPGDGIDQNCNGHDQKEGDNDDDGYTPAEGDCDDFNPSVHPGATEICWDGIDQNCDGTVDEGCCLTGLISLISCVETSGCSLSDINCITQHCGNEFYSLQEQYCFDFQCIVSLLSSPSLPFDATWTPEAKANYILSRCSMFDNDGDGSSGEQGDCDDTNPAIHPGAAEICGDGIDQNCTGSDAACNDVDEDGYTTDDCDDSDPSVHPGAPEVCDGLDNDCDMEVDEGVDDMPVWYLDADGDGYGNRDEITTACLQPSGYADNDLDCDDTDSTINRSAVEVCGDGIDQDCDGNDQECPYNIDDDRDGYTENQGDCDDTNWDINPGAMESCGDGIDNNCNSLVDENPDVMLSAVIASSPDLDFGNVLVLTAAEPPDLSPGCVNYLTYEWDIMSDGIYDFTGREVTVSWENLVSILGSVTPPVTFPVTLMVTDPGGQAVSSTVIFNIWPVLPVACFSVSPSVGYSIGDFFFDGTCSYHPNPSRRIEFFEWKVRGSEDVFMSGDIFNYSFDGTPFDIIPPETMRTLEIVLTVRDDYGRVSETSHFITLNDDQDNDGYAIPGDCFDSDPGMHPGATDICGDGIDQDCSGSDAECQPEIRAILPESITLNNGETRSFCIDLMYPAPEGGVTITCTASSPCLTISPSVFVNTGRTYECVTVTGTCPGSYTVTFTLGSQQFIRPVTVL
ncbi:MAG: putative metal-binding motif-containing protein [Bacteroidota bacterium]|nr:putative metal-binding motif-containing protein [Bacteroidota bacterium]